VIRRWAASEKMEIATEVVEPEKQTKPEEWRRMEKCLVDSAG